MSILALSPVALEPPSPMITSVTPVTPTLDPRSSSCPTARLSQALENQSQDGGSSLGPGPSHGPHLGGDHSKRSKKPPPLHTGADWKVVLHLPEIETWLRATSDRVTQLTHSAGQDGDNRHVDVHLVQLKILIDLDFPQRMEEERGEERGERREEGGERREERGGRREERREERGERRRIE
ncbi:unnamed protein product [Pleuronectes platessa]|uniref:Uncharacterized protein n=1 Tax=Pleuronectes platessa TaxID=8262 RepID=A0A9N7URQ5_PLEPL|nr:unnamed protein product [Pleuronectes platessa]